jgi:N-acylneuraminate cytidylyltransferase
VGLIAYIPARAGSKRIPRKNVRSLGGKPVLVRVMESIRRSKLTDRICVSTDDAVIKRLAEDNGAVVLDLRHSRLSHDRATLIDLFQKDVPRYLAHFGIDRDKAEVLFAIATAALVTPGIFRQSYDEFKRKRAAVLLATSKYSHPPFWAITKSPNGTWRPLFPKMLESRSQDLPETQVDAGLFYILNYKKMARSRGHWCNIKKGLRCFPVPSSVAVDVDTSDDWAMLEKNYRALHGTKS